MPRRDVTYVACAVTSIYVERSQESREDAATPAEESEEKRGEFFPRERRFLSPIKIDIDARDA